MVLVRCVVGFVHGTARKRCTTCDKTSTMGRVTANGDGPPLTRTAAGRLRDCTPRRASERTRWLRPFGASTEREAA